MNPKTDSILVLRVWLLDGRFHGEPEWPPAPARAFQALLAGACRTAEISTAAAHHLHWLEDLPAPIIVAPHAVVGQSNKQWVPNNDLDSVGGDPDKVGKIRTAKIYRPRIFDAQSPIVYAWRLSGSNATEHVAGISSLAEGLFQLGRGIDMAWATVETRDDSGLAALLSEHLGTVYRPTFGSTHEALALPCPQRGSLDSLDARYSATLTRLQPAPTKGKTLFRQPPKPRFRNVAYNTPPLRTLYDIRPVGQAGRFEPLPMTQIVAWTERLRDKAAKRLQDAAPDQAIHIERALIGRRVDGHPRLAPADRVRLILLPSIGHEKVERSIRRLLVEIPTSGPLRSGDIFWAFAGLTLEVAPKRSFELSLADDEGMLDHYGVGAEAGFRHWRTVTPIALPGAAARRRIEPSRQSEEAKGADERIEEEHRARQAVLHALRHADIAAKVAEIWVQREPFEAKGERVEAFAPGTRFAKERLWHVEVALQTPINGPLVVGDGRFLGLGLMAPIADPPDLLAFQITAGLNNEAGYATITNAFRRAVIARFQDALGPKNPLPPLVSGHEADKRPTTKPHLGFVFDAAAERLMILAPHRFGPIHWVEGWWKMKADMATLQSAMADFSELRAGNGGCLTLAPTSADPTSDPLLAPSHSWVSATPYSVNRHSKGGDAQAALAEDIRASCSVVGLPMPEVVVLEARGVAGEGLIGRVELHFSTAVPGPILLGRKRYKGGGLFRRLDA